MATRVTKQESKTSVTLAAAIAFLFGVILATAASTPPAEAHTTSTYYPKVWAADMTWKIGYTAGDVANQTGWTSMTVSDNAWNGVAGSWFDLTYGGRNHYSYWTGNACTLPSPNIWVFTASPINGGITKLCQGTNLTDAAILIDRYGDWYVSSGTPTNGEYDLRSLMVHEFGHVTGFMPSFNSGHFQTWDDTCDQSPVHTMCSGLSPETTWKRSLESHEEGLVAAAY